MYSDIYYQIYPLGFCGAPRENDGNTVPRIRKVIDWCDYLEGLGVDAVFFNPVFQSDHHGYDTRDFGTIDCRLGTNEDFAQVCRKLHEHGIRVVLDGVFNHVGRGFWAFQDVLERRWESPYKDWFYLNFDGDNGYHDGLWYEGWEGHYELVKLNLSNPQVVEHLFFHIRKWVEEFGIDALRLDVAYSLDREFLKKLRRFCDSLKPDFMLIGEVLFGDYRQIVNEEMLHSCTNYECYKGLYSSFNDKNLFEIAHSLHRQFGPEEYCIYRGLKLMTFADNHDVTRIASILRDPHHLPLVYGVLFGMPGIPCLYYGSEWGEPGQKEPGSDDALRPCFEAPCENELTEWVRSLIRIYKEHPAFAFGDYHNVAIQNRQLLFRRSIPEETVFTAVNLDENPAVLQCGELGGNLRNLMTGEVVPVQNSLELPGYSVFYYQLC